MPILRTSQAIMGFILDVMLLVGTYFWVSLAAIPGGSLTAVLAAILTFLAWKYLNTSQRLPWPLPPLAALLLAVLIGVGVMTMELGWLGWPMVVLAFAHGALRIGTVLYHKPADRLGESAATREPTSTEEPAATRELAPPGEPTTPETPEALVGTLPKRRQVHRPDE